MTSIEEEASWDTALKIGVHLVDVLKPTTALLLIAVMMMCTPMTAAEIVQLNETTVFPEGLALYESPIGGGHLMTLPPMSDCHKAMSPPLDNISMRLFVRRHNSQRGEIYAMQRIKTTRCTHLSWFFYTTFFPDQIQQEALQNDEMEMIENALIAMRGDPKQRPSKFYSGEQQSYRQDNMHVWMTNHEVQYAISYFRFHMCVDTINYAFIIGQYTLYDTLKMTSDIADLADVN